MDKRIGIILIIIAIMLGAFAVANKITSENIVSDIRNETGTCFVGGTCLHEQTSITFIVLSVVAGVIAIIGALIIVLDVMGRKRRIADKINERNMTARKASRYLSGEAKSNEEKPEPPPTLTSEQKKLYDILMGAGGSMLQGELVEKSGMNKVTVSRILDKLEMQGVVERRRHGMSNIVVLKHKK